MIVGRERVGWREGEEERVGWREGEGERVGWREGEGERKYGLPFLVVSSEITVSLCPQFLRIEVG